MDSIESTIYITEVGGDDDDDIEMGLVQSL